MEVWAVQTPGLIYLRTTVPNRMGQLVDAEISIGPNRQGGQFKISTIDREENQARCADPAADVFRNGMLARLDADQQADPQTASVNAITAEDILDIFDLDQAGFEARVQELSEVPLRRMVDLGQAMDVSHRRLEYLTELIATRYSVAKSQPSIVGNTAERLS